MWTGPSQTGGIYTPPTTPGSDTLTYTFTDLNNCESSDEIILNIIVPTIPDAGPDLFFCLNDLPYQLVPETNPGGIWSGSGVNSAGLFNPAVAGAGDHFLFYTINTGTTCETYDSLLITVFPIPQVNAGLDVEICSGIEVTLTGTAASGTAPYQFAWEPATGATSSLTNNYLDLLLFQPSIADLTLDYSLTVTDTNGCISSDDVQVIVHPLPVVDAGSDQVVCAQPINYILNNYSPTTGGTGVWSGPNVTGNIYSPPSLPGADTLTYTFTDFNSCNSGDDLIMTINNPVFPEAGNDDALCLNSPPIQIDPVSNPGGSWSGNGISAEGMFDPALAEEGVHQIVYTINTGTTCQTSDSLIITVHSVPAVNAGDDQSLCSGDSASFTANITGGLSPLQIEWINSSNILGDNTGIDILVSGINNGSTPLDISFTINVADSNQCVVSDIVGLTIRPLPIVYAGPDTTICFSPAVSYLLTNFSPPGGTWVSAPGNSGVLSGVNYQTGGTGSDTLYYNYSDVFNCSNRDTLVINVTSPLEIDAGPDLSFCISDGISILPMPLPVNPPANYTASWIGDGISFQNGVYSFSPSAAGPGTHILNYIFEFGATCAASDAIEIYVGSLPEIVSPDLEFCHGVMENLGISLVAGSGTFPLVFNWQSNPGISNTQLLSPDFNAVNTTGTDLAINLNLTISDDAGCTTIQGIPILMHPLPDVNAGENIILCNQSIEYILTGYSPVTGGTGTWSGSDNLENNIYLPDAIGSEVITYSFTDLFNCNNSDQRTVTTVAPQFPDAGADESFCLSDELIELSPVTLPGGKWIGNGVSGDNGNYYFDPSIAGIGTHLITYIINDSTTCETSDTRFFRVFPMPVANAGSDLETCSGISFEFAASATFGTNPYYYSWSPVTNIISGVTSSHPQLTIINNSSSDLVRNYTVTISDSAGCISIDSVIAIVHPLPVADAGPDTTLCNQPIPYLLGGFSPVNGGNGIWSESNNLSGLNYTASGTGTEVLSYTFTDSNGCINSDELTIEIVAPVFPDAGSDLEFCINSDNELLVPLTISGGTWSGPGVTIVADTFFFDPSLSGIDEFNLNYTINPNTTCETKDSLNVTVFGLPVVDAGPDLGSCIDTSCIQLANFSPQTPTGEMPVTGLFYGEGSVSSSGLFCPQLNLPGTYSIYYQYADPATGCINRDSLVFLNHPLPVASFSIDSVLCINTPEQSINLSIGDSLFPGSVSYNWQVFQGNSELFNFQDPAPAINLSVSGQYALSLIITTETGCAADTIIPLNVHQTPAPSFTLSADTGCAPVSIAINNSTSGFSPEYIWSVEGLYTDSTATPDNIQFPSPVMGDTTFTIALQVSNQCGAAEISLPFTASPTPVAEFVLAEYSGCSPFVPSITNLSYGSPTSFLWLFSDGFNSNEAEPSGHGLLAIDNDTTVYEIKLIVFNDCGSDSVKTMVTVYPNTVVSFFNTDPPFGCADLLVEFSNFSSGANTYVWNFGDSSAEVSSFNTSHLYQSGGIYTIELIASDGCSFDTSHYQINVLPKPDVAFTLPENVICQGTILGVVNLTEDAIAYLWDFGDGSEAVTFEPQHLYSIAGQYTVALIGYSPIYGCPDTSHQTIVVQNYPDINIVVDPSSGCMPLIVNFSNNTLFSSSIDWDFGNGLTSTSLNPSTSYTTFGEYTVNLTVYNFNINSGLDCPIDTSVIISVFPRPVSNFVLDTAAACGQFTSITPHNLSNGATSHSWHWRNLNSILFEPSISISDTGITNIRLIVSNEFSCTDTISRTFDLIAQPTPELQIIPSRGCVPLTVELTSLSNYGDSWVWDFGDGNTVLGGASVLHEYTNPGSFSVSLSVENEQQCFADTTIQQAVIVHPRAHSEFTLEPETITQSYPFVLFQNESSGSDEYQFLMGDGSIYPAFINQHIYNDPEIGEYEITLIAQNQFNCPDTSTHYLKVLESASVFIPNSFTPNGDDRNETFAPVIDGKLKIYDFIIYDRWGHLVFETLDREVKWDGTFFNNGKKPIKQDVYVYKLIYLFENEITPHELIGRVAIIY